VTQDTALYSYLSVHFSLQ